jgi:hypothetical protein
VVFSGIPRYTAVPTITAPSGKNPTVDKKTLVNTQHKPRGASGSGEWKGQRRGGEARDGIRYGRGTPGIEG